MHAIERHINLLQTRRSQLGTKLLKVHSDPLPPLLDPDDALYGGAFPSKADLAMCRSIRTTSPADLHTLERKFKDPRFAGLMRHYIARNHPEFLSDVQQAIWTQRVHDRLTEPQSRDDLSWDDWCVDMTAAINAASPETRLVLESAQSHGLQVAAAAGLTSCA
jgi:exodeoxyribonuclease-1